MKKYGWICLAILALDQLTKWLVQGNLPLMGYQYPYGGIGIFKDFFGVELAVVHTVNRGAAWGQGAEFQMILVAIRVVFLFGLGAYLRWWNRYPEDVLPLMVVGTGAFGNVIDTFVYGHVIDFIAFVFWGWPYPVFNVADSAIFLGVAALLWQSRRRSHACGI
ncbi:MAG: signal peptidase II [Chlamydiia bacterium]|nr:signal peptidase II [Chlamydiia bacterium]